MAKTNQTILFLKPGREKSVRTFHPWIFSGAVDRVEGDAAPGGTVEVYSSKGEWLCRASFSPRSSIRARVWTWDKDQPINGTFFSERLQNAIRLREALRIADDTEMYRLVHAESDGLPGLIVDRYRDVLVAQFLTAGAEASRDLIWQALSTVEGIRCVYERSDADVRELEGLPIRNGLLSGSLPDQPLQLKENGLSFLVDITEGHKTGFYLDQRENRETFRRMNPGGEVLNCFSYTGGFSVYGAAGEGSHLTSVDSSAPALALARRNFEINGIDPVRHTVLEGD
ncbi:MAG: class I SAM-dependent rRNA methyltransferase, partial [Anaerolineaceae bacterium]